MSHYLFSQPSFFSGVGRVLDLGGIFDDYTPCDTDLAGLHADWEEVSRDLRASMAAECDIQARMRPRDVDAP